MNNKMVVGSNASEKCPLDCPHRIEHEFGARCNGGNLDGRGFCQALSVVYPGVKFMELINELPGSVECKCLPKEE